MGAFTQAMRDVGGDSKNASKIEEHPCGGRRGAGLVARHQRCRGECPGGQEGHAIRQHGDGHPGPAQPRRRRRQQFPPHQRQLRADPLLPEPADQSRQCRQAAAVLDLPARRAREPGDDTDRHRRRHVRDHGLRPRVRARRAHRRAAVELRARDGADHDLLLRPEQSRRRGLRRHGLLRDARRPSWWRSTPRPARRSGTSRSPIPSSATARRWRRRRSTARS